MILAYLDPGSGSALVGTLIAVVGAALFSLKSFFYRLVSRKSGDRQSSTSTLDFDSIALLSEGKNYWGTFRLIVEELIARKVHFAYYTMDLHDPALLIDSEYMHSRLYDKNKAASYHKLSNIKADILLATSPNIGTPGFPIKRSPNVKTMAHVFHAFADISAYHVGSLDNYDIVLTVGPHQDKPIREVEKARALKPKTLIPAGLPYFDAQYLTLSNQTIKQSNNRTILIGPSWGAKGLLREYGTGFIVDLAKAGYDIILRPHPQSYIAEPEFIDRCKAETSSYPNVVWDSEVVGTKAMEVSSLLISDTSSIRFDYAFLYGKPVITLDIPHEKQLEYEGQYMSSIWTDEVADKLGRVITHANVGGMVEIVKDVLASSATSNRQLREETIANLGMSHKKIVDFMIERSVHPLSNSNS